MNEAQKAGFKANFEAFYQCAVEYNSSKNPRMDILEFFSPSMFLPLDKLLRLLDRNTILDTDKRTKYKFIMTITVTSFHASDWVSYLINETWNLWKLWCHTTTVDICPLTDFNWRQIFSFLWSLIQRKGQWDTKHSCIKKWNFADGYLTKTMSLIWFSKFGEKRKELGYKFFKKFNVKARGSLCQWESLISALSSE